MDWQNERWIKFYTRDTYTWRRWPWQARCVFALLLRVVDRSGLLDVGDDDPAVALPVLLDLPGEIVGAGWPAISASGTAIHDGKRIVIPNFAAAQAAVTSPAERKRRQRERETAQPRPDRSRAVTPEHAESRADTRAHAASLIDKTRQDKKDKNLIARSPDGRPSAAADRTRELTDRIWQSFEPRRCERLNGRPRKLTADTRRRIAALLGKVAALEDCDQARAADYVIESLHARIEDARANPDHRRWIGDAGDWRMSRYEKTRPEYPPEHGQPERGRRPYQPALADVETPQRDRDRPRETAGPTKAGSVGFDRLAELGKRFAIKTEDA